MSRLQGEKERLNAQYLERSAEMDGRVKKLEGERQRADLDHARAIREKDSTID